MKVDDLRQVFTLCIVRRGYDILLGLKKKGLGTGLLNGFGGKVKTGETIMAAAIRELEEESGLLAINIEEAGVIEISFQNNAKILEVHIFYVDRFSGKEIESDEMIPQWFHIGDVPFERMWPDDIYWLPLLLCGKKFQASFLLDRPASADYISQIVSLDVITKK